jgi:hypothetical protein
MKLAITGKSGGHPRQFLPANDRRRSRETSKRNSPQLEPLGPLGSTPAFPTLPSK